MAQALESLRDALIGIGQQYAAKKERDDQRQEHLDDVSAERAWIEGRDKQQFANQEQLLQDTTTEDAKRYQSQLDANYTMELKRIKEKPEAEVRAEAATLGLPDDMPLKDMQAAVANTHAKIAADAKQVENAPNVASVKELYTQARKDFDDAVKQSAALESKSAEDILRAQKAQQVGAIVDQAKPAGMTRAAYLKKIGSSEEQLNANPEAVAGNPKLQSVADATTLIRIQQTDPKELTSIQAELKRQQSAAQQRAAFAHQALLEIGKEGMRYGATGLTPPAAPVLTPSTPDAATPKTPSFFDKSTVAPAPTNPIEVDADKQKALNSWWAPRQEMNGNLTEAQKFLDATNQATPSAQSVGSSGVGLGFGFSTGAGAPIQTPGYQIPGYGFFRKDEAQAKINNARKVVSETPAKIKQLDSSVPDYWRGYFGAQPAAAAPPSYQYYDPSVDQAPPTM